MNGPAVDIAALADKHTFVEFVQRDLDATMETMTESPHLKFVPVMSGGVGFQKVRSFYERFIAQLPDDVQMTPVSRTVGEDQLVDELVLSFTHEREWDAMLPGVSPSGRFVRLPCCVVMRFESGRLAHEHIYWDHASLLAQVGILDPAELPIAGAEQADKLLDSRGDR